MKFMKISAASNIAVLLCQVVRGNQYVGCYIDEPNRALTPQAFGDYMTIEWCIGECTLKGK